MAKNKNVKAEVEEEKAPDLVTEEIIDSPVIEEDLVVEEVKSAPVVSIPDAPVKQVVKKEKIKLIKELPRLYIAGNYYSGKKGEDLIVPSFVAYVLRGSDNKTETFAV